MVTTIRPTLDGSRLARSLALLPPLSRTPLPCHASATIIIVDPEGDKVRYLQIEIFDYNYAPGIKATWK